MYTTMSVKSILSNIISSVNKYGKSIKSTRLKFVETLFTSRLFLYFLVFVTSVVLFTYVNTRDITSVVALLLIGFLASFFTKNMAVLLSIALIFTWLLKYAMKLRYEGFEGKEEEEKDKEDQPQDNKKETMTDKESSDSDKSSESDKPSDKEQEKELKALKKDYESFEEIQKNILGGVKEINKELDKAETFINKYERYKNKHGSK